MRDMSPRGDRSIRNIPVSSLHKKRPARFEAEEVEESEAPRPRKRKKGGKKLLIFGVLVALLFGIFGLLLSTLFAGASVVVYPRTATLPQTSTLSAMPNAPAGTLSYQTVTITSGATTSVAASGSQKVSRQASGVITITNAFNAQSQRLIANTRFEAPDGKIYRIHDSVVVPGMKGTTPGTATITVYADAPGPEYNRGETHFTIPGFKGDAKYTKFYADASSITGGFVGNEPAVAKADLEAAKTAIGQKLEESARTSVEKQMPQGFVIVDNTFQFAYGELRQSADGADKATLTQSLTATVAIVRSSDVASMIAKQTVPNYSGEAVQFVSSDVKLAANANTKPVGKIDITVANGGGLIWQYEKEAVKAALLGKNKSTFESIVSSFKPALVGAEVTLRPFWLSSFPSDPSKITVTEGVKK